MSAITTSTITEIAPSCGIKKILVETPTTATTGDTIAINLNSSGLGGTVFLGVIGWVHTTENSVVVQEQPTTSVSTTTVTLTVGGSAVSSKKRVYELTYR